jgi:hypothetical protein
MTAITVFVLVLRPVTAIAWVRQLGRQRLGCRGCNIGVEHRRGSRRPDTVYVNLLQEQIIPNFEKVQKWRVAPNDGAHVLDALVQPPKDVEDENPYVVASDLTDLPFSLVLCLFGLIAYVFPL